MLLKTNAGRRRRLRFAKLRRVTAARNKWLDLDRNPLTVKPLRLVTHSWEASVSVKTFGEEYASVSLS